MLSMTKKLFFTCILLLIIIFIELFFISKLHKQKLTIISQRSLTKQNLKLINNPQTAYNSDNIKQIYVTGQILPPLPNSINDIFTVRYLSGTFQARLSSDTSYYIRFKEPDGISPPDRRSFSPFNLSPNNTYIFEWIDNDINIKDIFRITRIDYQI